MVLSYTSGDDSPCLIMIGSGECKKMPFLFRFRKRPPTSQFAADIEDVPYRTTIQVNNLLEDYLQIDRYSASGFVLNNGFRVIGPCAVFPKSILSWNVSVFCMVILPLIVT